MTVFITQPTSSDVTVWKKYVEYSQILGYFEISGIPITHQQLRIVVDTQISGAGSWNYVSIEPNPTISVATVISNGYHRDNIASYFTSQYGMPNLHYIASLPYSTGTYDSRGLIEVICPNYASSSPKLLSVRSLGNWDNAGTRHIIHSEGTMYYTGNAQIDTIRFQLPASQTYTSHIRVNVILEGVL